MEKKKPLAKIFKGKIYIEKKLFIVLAMVLIVIIGLFNIENLHQIVIIDDELGYWGIAKKWVGIDWSSVVRRAGYYSCGYPMFLVPILLLVKNPILQYQFAIILNICFLEGIFLCIRTICKKVVSGISENTLTGIAFLATIYPNNILQANVAWSECLQSFCISFLILLLLKLYEKIRNRELFLFYFLSFFLYIIHQRNIGILVVSLLFFFYLIYRRKINWYQIILLTGGMISLFLLFFVLKNHMQQSLWYEGTVVSNNDYSGQTGKIAFLFSCKGIVMLLYGIIGRLFYLLVSTYTILGWGLQWVFYRFVSDIKSIVKEKKCNCSAFFFIALMFGANYLIAVIFMIYPISISHVIYGRYIETFVPFLLGISLSVFMQKVEKGQGKYFSIWKTVSFYILLIVLTGMLLKVFFEKENLSGINFIAVAGIYRYCDSNSFDIYRCIIECILIAVVLLLLLLQKNEKKKYRNILAFLIAGSMFVYASAAPINRILQFQKNRDNNKTIISQFEQMQERLNDIYYFIPDEEEYDSAKNRAYLQYWLNEEPLICISYDELNQVSPGDYLVMSYKDLFSYDLNYHYSLIYAYGDYVVYKCEKDKTDNTYILDGQLFDTQTSKNEGTIKIQGEGLYKIDSGYWSYKKGKYSAIFNGQVTFDNNYVEQLYFTVRDLNGNTYAEKKIVKEDIKNCNLTVKLQFELQQTTDIHLEVYTINKGVIFELERVVLAKQ